MLPITFLKPNVLGTLGVTIIVVVLGLFAPFADAQVGKLLGINADKTIDKDPVKVSLVAKSAPDAQGHWQLGLRLQHDPHWHTYWRNPGDSGLATQIQWQLPQGWRASEIAWPVPKRIPVGPLANYGYEDDMVLPITVSADVSTFNQAGQVRLKAKAMWLMCKDVCIPGEAELEIPLEWGNKGQNVLHSSPQITALFAAADAAQPKLGTNGQALKAEWIKPNDTGVGASNLMALRFDASADAQLKDAQFIELFAHVEGLVNPPSTQKLIRDDRDDSGGRGGNTHQSGWVLLLPMQAEAAQSAAFKDNQFDGVLKTSQGAWLVKAELSPNASSNFPVWNKTTALASSNPSTGNPRSAAAPVLNTESPLAWWLAMLFALLGGAILNIMPCVFPVLSLKVLSLAGDAGNTSQARRNGMAFSVGVIASFVAMAGLLVALRGAGEAVGWGFQLQSPWVVFALSLLFVALGLNFMGVFEFGLRVTQIAGAAESKVLDTVSTESSWLSSFASGVLAVLVATPCTAPFLGSAVGFTLNQSVPLTLLVFLAAGVGMALPYLVLSHAPGLLKKLPRPGLWMNTFKQVLAFPMFLTAVWLAWVLGALLNIDAMAWLAAAAVLLGLALWMYGRQQQLVGATRFNRVGMLIALIAVGLIAYGKVIDSSSDQSRAVQWPAYDEQQIAAWQAEGNTVFVDFTAAWCISCQANKALVFDTDRGRALLMQSNVRVMRADWTKRDARITAALARYGRNAVPVYLVLKPNKAPQLLPELLTTDILRKALQNNQ